MAESVKSFTASGRNPSFDHQPSENTDFADEIQGLRAEIARLSSMMSEKTGEVYDKVADSANSAASYVSSEANSVAGTIREHPAATTTLFTLIGAVGFALGYAVAMATAESKQAWYQRYLGDRF
jgi:thiamine pyrophosphate-dependent acetolactate synthase large subunit-like protein